MTFAPALAARIVDCTDPGTLAAIGVRPDHLAHHDRTVTQAIARRLHRAGAAGLRWWSAPTGAWHTTVVFTDRERDAELILGMPHAVSLSDPVLGRTLPVLGIRVP